MDTLLYERLTWYYHKPQHLVTLQYQPVFADGWTMSNNFMIVTPSLEIVAFPWLSTNSVHNCWAGTDVHVKGFGMCLVEFNDCGL